jgi:AcrR family transcriptional regulator
VADPPPALRADAARNRATLLAVATRVFAAAGEPPSMRAIAREAGVGVGTLYRHFPTREDLVDAVYADQAERLTAGARDLLATHPPVAALRHWMELFGAWLATKRGMLGALGPGAATHPRSRAEMLTAVVALLEAGRAAGALRSDVDAEDVVAALVGVFTASAEPARTARLLDVLTDGLRAR